MSTITLTFEADTFEAAVTHLLNAADTVEGFVDSGHDFDILDGFRVLDRFDGQQTDATLSIEWDLYEQEERNRKHFLESTFETTVDDLRVGDVLAYTNMPVTQSMLEADVLRPDHPVRIHNRTA